MVAALVILTVTAAAAACSYQEKNAQEQETICNEKEIPEIADTKESSACEKANDAAQHQQGAENTGSPSKTIDYCSDFHFDWF
jgi:flagellar motility protein MotE (MotC chaperone)